MTCTTVPGARSWRKLPHTPRFSTRSYVADSSAREVRTPMATIPTPVDRTSMWRAPRGPRAICPSARPHDSSPAVSGATSAAVAVTTRMRTLLGTIVEPPHEGAEIHHRRAKLRRRHDVQHLAVGRLAVRNGTLRGLFRVRKQLEGWRGAVDVDVVLEVQTVALAS